MVRYKERSLRRKKGRDTDSDSDDDRYHMSRSHSRARYETKSKSITLPKVRCMQSLIYFVIETCSMRIYTIIKYLLTL